MTLNTIFLTGDSGKCLVRRVLQSAVVSIQMLNLSILLLALANRAGMWLAILRIECWAGAIAEECCI